MYLCRYSHLCQYTICIIWMNLLCFWACTRKSNDVCVKWCTCMILSYPKWYWNSLWMAWMCNQCSNHLYNVCMCTGIWWKYTGECSNVPSYYDHDSHILQWCTCSYIRLAWQNKHCTSSCARTGCEIMICTNRISLFVCEIYDNKRGSSLGCVCVCVCVTRWQAGERACVTHQ